MRLKMVKTGGSMPWIVVLALLIGKGSRRKAVCEGGSGDKRLKLDYLLVMVKSCYR